MSSGEPPESIAVSDRLADRRIEFDATSETYRTEYDSHQWSASEAVIAAVSTATELDPLDLPPLYSVVDPDALDVLFLPTADHYRPGGTIAFEYVEWQVTVNAHGTVLVEPAGDRVDE